MQVFYTTIRPWGGSKGLFSHKGEEFGLVLKGRLELVLKDKVYMVEENETVYFSSEILHGWTNRGDADAVVIWVITPPSF
jgi:quercetin dioxygenase-like cupin family protein